MEPLYIGRMSIDRAPRRVAALPPAIRILVVLACSVIALGGMWLARDVIGPLAIGAVIVIICYPLGTAITRWGAPRWVGSTAVILLGYVILGVLAALLTFAITEFVRLVTELMPDLTRLTQQVYMWLREQGVDAEIGTQISAMLNTSRVSSRHRSPAASSAS
jgi:predicted PurR-regulated permease PerM